MTVVICKSLQTENINHFKLKIRLHPSLKRNDIDGVLVKTSWLTVYQVHSRLDVLIIDGNSDDSEITVVACYYSETLRP